MPCKKQFVCSNAFCNGTAYVPVQLAFSRSYGMRLVQESRDRAGATVITIAYRCTSCSSMFFDPDAFTLSEELVEAEVDDSIPSPEHDLDV